MLSVRAKNGSLSCPKLSVEGAALEILPDHPSYFLESYTVDFSGLRAARRVTIKQKPWLEDFTMFAGLFTGENPAISTPEQWVITDCGYNPTFEDMKAGRYKEP